MLTISYKPSLPLGFVEQISQRKQHDSTDRISAVSLATFEFAEYNSKMMYMDAYSAITQLDLWSWLSVFTPHEKKGFMVYDATLCKIEGALKTGRSGYPLHL